MESDRSSIDVSNVNADNAQIMNRKTNNLSNILYKIKNLLKYMGPAFVISVAYIDPGNFATNISGGSKFNYELIWVILWSNLIAIFLQTMSAKLGIATGKNLPEICAKVFSKTSNCVFWIVAEIGAMATDLAEFLGATLGLYLLFRIPLIYAGFLTGALTFLIVYMEKYGQRVIEFIITFLVTIICIAYTLELFLSKPDWTQVGIHTIIPMLSNDEAVLIAVGMLGATVMPHVIYLHSHLVQYRRSSSSNLEKLNHLKMEKIDIVVAMNIAFIVNAAMAIVSAAVFYKNGISVNTIEEAHKSLQPLLGSLSSGAFGIALLASGLSSSAVGTLAGQTIMKGFINLNIPINIRRLITMIPAMIIIAIGVNPMHILVLSQVVLSFILPFPVIQMLYVASSKDLMGILVNKPFTKILGVFITLMIISLNALLLYLTFF